MERGIGLPKPTATITEKPQLDQKIDKDLIDLKIASAKSNNRLLTSLTGLIPTGAIVPAGLFAGSTMLVTPFALGSIGGILYSGVSEARSARRVSGYEKKNPPISGDDLIYRADRLVYRGKEINAGSFKLIPGDNFYDVSLPYIRGENATNTEEVDILSKAYNRLVLKDLQKKLSNKNYKVVSFDIFAMDFVPDRKERRFNPLEGKNTDEDDMRFRVMSKEEFEQMSLEPNEEFQKIVDALEQKIGHKIAGRGVIDELRGLGNLPRGTKLEAAQKLRVKVDNLFSSFAEAEFNGLPSVTIERDANYTPQRKREDVHPVLKVSTNPKGVFLEQISYTRGDRRSLVKLDLPMEEVLNPDSRYQPLLLTYAVSQILKDPKTLEDATNTKILTLDEINKRVDELGLQIVKPYHFISEVIRPKNESMKSRVGHAMLASTIGGAALAGGINALGITTEKIVPNVSHAQNPALGNSQGSEIALLQDSETPGFPESLPKSHLDWKIESFGNAKPEGYYVMSTSSKYFDGKWEIDNNTDQATEFIPLPLDFGDRLDLTGVIKLDLSGNASFRLPIKAGTDLTKIKVTDLNDQLIDPHSYQVLRFKDGTYEVKTSLGPLAQKAFIKVTESLAAVYGEDPTGHYADSTVHATTRIPSIDVTKLSPKALEILKTSGNFIPHLPILVADKPYSIDPPDAYKLSSIDGTPESFVNAAVSLSASDCDPSNGELALLSSAIASPTYLNVARGYMNGPQNGASGGNFLNAKAAHEFTIDNKGKIWDGTPSAGFLKGDKMTEEYLFGNKNNFMSGFEDQYNQTWNEQLDELKREQDFQNGIENLLEIGGIGLGAIVGAKGIDSFKKRFTKEKIHQAREGLRFKRALRGMDAEQLKEAYNFFSWLSFGGQSEYSPTAAENLPTTSTEASVQAIKKSAVLENTLRAYIKSPDEFEEAANIKNSRKLRRLAGYLIT